MESEGGYQEVIRQAQGVNLEGEVGVMEMNEGVKQVVKSLIAVMDY